MYGGSQVQDPGTALSSVATDFEQLRIIREKQRAGSGLTAEVEQELERVASKRQATVNDSCIEQLAAIPPVDAVSILRAIWNASPSTPIRSFSPYLAKTIQSRLRAKGAAPTAPEPQKPWQGGGRLPANSQPANDIDEGEVWFDTQESPDKVREMSGAASGGTHLHARHLPVTKREIIFSEAENPAFSALDFRKRCLIVFLTGNYPDRLKLLTAHDLQEFRTVPLEKEESFLRALAARRNIKIPAGMTKSCLQSTTDLSINECWIDANGHCTYKGRTPVPAMTALLRTLGDRLLLVRFADTDSGYSLYTKILEEGIDLGMRHYEYFIHKDPKEKKTGKMESGSPSVKCFFVCLNSFAEADDVSFLTIKNVRDLRNYFCHIYTTSDIAKLIARLQLLLSKTVQAPLDLSLVNVEVDDDVEYKDSEGRPSCATDGAGQISPDLAVLLPSAIIKGQYLTGREEGPSLLSQVRAFSDGRAFKGTLLAVNDLKNTVKFRKSMMKVPTDPTLRGLPSFNSLEVVTTSRKPREASVSRELIMLLSHRHVPDAYFLQLLSKFIEDVKHNYDDLQRVMKEYKDIENGTRLGEEVYRMVAAGMDPAKDLHLQESLKTLAKWKLRDLHKFRLPMPKSWFLMGTADPSDSLEHDQIALILDDGPIVCKKALVYKHPGLHFGDIQVKEATWTPELEEVIPPNARRNALIFSTKGPVSAPEEISNSDLDGDLFWVCINPELTRYVQPCTPYRRKPGAKNQSKRPADMSPRELEKALHKEFLDARFVKRGVIGMLCYQHTAHLDRYLTLTYKHAQEKKKLERIIEQLVDCHQEAVDSEKSGVKVTIPKGIDVEQVPHYLRSSNKPVYRSTSIIGKMYDMIHAIPSSMPGNVHIDPDLEYEGFEQHMGCWERHFQAYRSEMTRILRSNHPCKDDACEDLFVRYRKILYGAETLKESTKPRSLVLSEASAIYKVVYTRACRQDMENKRMGGDTSEKWTPSVRFAWAVALHALCTIYAEKQAGQPVIHACKPPGKKIVLDD